MRKEKLISGLLGLFFFIISAAVWLKPASDVSMTERRALAQLPELSAVSVADGSFMEDFESYALDQFPLREHFRRLKAVVSRKILRSQDDHGIYVSDGYAIRMEYPFNEASLENAAAKFEKLYENYLKDHGCTVYAAVIPDKNYFLAEKSGHLAMDYDRLFEIMEQKLPYARFIMLTEQLDITHYYQTDIHWRQETLEDVAVQLGNAMGVDVTASYEVKTLAEPFYGVYFGQSALELSGERLSYLTNEMLAQCTVYHYEDGRTTGIYDFAKAEGSDPYELFLSGSESLLRIENPNAENERELIVFRDSFASSLVPLLAGAYRAVTLVDIRYIQSGILDRFIEFQGKDVLFLYSTSVLNHSETLK